jgi:hypothetical protein
LDWIEHTLRKPEGSIEKAALDWKSTGNTKTWETKVDMEKIHRRGNRRKSKDVERDEEVGQTTEQNGKTSHQPYAPKGATRDGGWMNGSRGNILVLYFGGASFESRPEFRLYLLR